MDTQSQPTSARELLETLTVERPVERIELHRVTLPPGQRTGEHVHAGGTIGWVVSGEIVFALEAEVAVTLSAGEGFVEPAGRRVTQFDNASMTEPATFAVAYPLHGDDELITMTSAKP